MIEPCNLAVQPSVSDFLRGSLGINLARSGGSYPPRKWAGVRSAWHGPLAVCDPKLFEHHFVTLGHLSQATRSARFPGCSSALFNSIAVPWKLFIIIRRLSNVGSLGRIPDLTLLAYACTA